MSNSESDNNEKVTFTISHLNGYSAKYTVKRNVLFSRVKSIFCEKGAFTEGGLSFRYKGRNIEMKETPHLVGVEDGDVINAVPEQVGGYK